MSIDDVCYVVDFLRSIGSVMLSRMVLMKECVSGGLSKGVVHTVAGTLLSFTLACGAPLAVGHRDAIDRGNPYTAIRTLV